MEPCSSDAVMLYVTSIEPVLVGINTAPEVKGETSNVDRLGAVSSNLFTIKLIEASLRFP